MYCFHPVFLAQYNIGAVIGAQKAANQKESSGNANTGKVGGAKHLVIMNQAIENI